MKSRIALFALVLALAGGLMAQSVPWLPTYSLKGSVTQGLMTNDIESAFGIGNDFGSVSSPFFFGGVSGNPTGLANNGIGTSFIAGYYQPGSIPFSAYGNFSATGLGIAIPSNFTVDTTAASVWTSGTTTTTTNYKTTEAVTTYTVPSGLGTLYLNLQGLVSIAGIQTGLFFTDNGDWTATSGSANLYKNVATTYYNTTTSATAAPVTNADYTITEKFDNVTGQGAAAASNNVSGSLNFAVPFALKTGNLAHAGYVQVDLTNSATSGTYSLVQSAHTYTAGAASNPDYDLTIKNVTNTTFIRGLYTLTMPGFFMTSAGANFSAGVLVSDSMAAGTGTYEKTTKNYDLSVLGAKTALGGTYTNAQTNYATAHDLNFAVYASHTVPFAPAAGFSLVLKPNLEVSYEDNIGNNLPIQTGGVQYSQPLNTSFVYDGTSYSKITVTSSGTPATKTNLGLGFGLPTAVEIKPDGWAFGFFAGSTLQVNFVWNTTTAAYGSSTQTTDTYTGSTVTATSVSTTTTLAAPTTQLTPTVSEAHALGIFIPFAGKTRLDVSLNSNNLLAFDSLKMQLYMPLK
ncbi:MAG TPA: hypothetical protein VMV44_05945 [Rectinemataceae bacterium]|nr:hypothetical protein [Rectinemataceae bacterium]